MSSDKNFWLIAIEESWLSVALVLNQSGSYQVASIGPKIIWNGSSDSLVAAIDSSLSSAANQVGLPPENEPQKAAFILPPFWVGTDGKIVPDHLKQIEQICKSLVFQPMGFIANDEAIVEEANLREGLPVSFVLVNVAPESVSVSLVYLGKVKGRLRKAINGEFSPEIIDNALIEMGVGNALPPQIVVFGDYSIHALNLIRNYNWIGKKNPQTFLHFPEVNALDFERLFSIYSQTIVSQIDVTSVISTSQSQLNSYETVEVVSEDEASGEPVISEEDDSIVNNNQPESISQTEVEIPEDIPQSDTSPSPDIELAVAAPVAAPITTPQPDLVEVNASDFGFSNIADTPVAIPAPSPVLPPAPPSFAPPAPPVPVLNSFPQDLNSFVNSLPPEKPPAPPLFSSPTPAFKPAKKTVSLPKFKLKIGLGNKMGFLAVVLLIVFLSLTVPVLISSAQITLFVTPYNFTKSVAVTLDSSTTNFDSTNKIIPVNKRKLDVTASAATKATGVKTTGDKAKGDVVIFNKLDKSQSIAKGTVLVDPQGHKFELLTSVVVAASTLNLQSGTITMGQTRAMATASDIGSQYNINKDTALTIQNTPTSSLIAKADNAFTGGFSKQIAAVSAEDKVTLQNELTNQIKKSTQDKIKNELSSIAGVITDSIKTDQNKIEYSREVGEEADELKGDIKASVTVFVFDTNLKTKLVENFLKDDENYQKSVINVNDFDTSFKVSKLDGDKATAQLTITGKSLPIIDQTVLKNKLRLKPTNVTQQVLRINAPRVYDFNIKQNFVGFLKIMPFNPDNIKFDIKTEN